MDTTATGSRRIWTVGHSNRPLALFLDLLAEHRIDALFDVRRHPRSRRHPHFTAERLWRALSERGCTYRHLPVFGGRRRTASAPADSPNGALAEAGFRAYADHALTPPFRTALAELVAACACMRIALLCAEADPARCHRSILADHLLARGVAVVHILAPGRSAPARLHPRARIRPDGAVIYPPAQGDMFLCSDRR